MTATGTGATLEHAIGARGVVVDPAAQRRRPAPRGRWRIGSRSARSTATTSSGMFAVELGEGSVSLRSTARRRRRRTPRTSRSICPGVRPSSSRPTSGDIDVDGLAGDQRYRTASGDITLRAVTDRIAVEAVSGRHRGARPPARPRCPCERCRATSRCVRPRFGRSRRRRRAATSRSPAGCSGRSVQRSRPSAATCSWRRPATCASRWPR